MRAFIERMETEKDRKNELPHRQSEKHTLRFVVI